MIYVVDDNTIILRTIEVALAHLGPVRTSSLWSEVAAEIVRGGAKRDGGDALICDLEMPGIRGDEFCRIVRKYNQHIPIVLFTASPGRAAVDAADAVIDKARGVKELVAQVERLIGEARARHAAS